MRSPNTNTNTNTHQEKPNIHKRRQYRALTSKHPKAARKDRKHHHKHGTKPPERDEKASNPNSVAPSTPVAHSAPHPTSVPSTMFACPKSQINGATGDGDLQHVAHVARSVAPSTPVDCTPSTPVAHTYGGCAHHAVPADTPYTPTAHMPHAAQQEPASSPQMRTPSRHRATRNKGVDVSATPVASHKPDYSGIHTPSAHHTHTHTHNMKGAPGPQHSPHFNPPAPSNPSTMLATPTGGLRPADSPAACGTPVGGRMTPFRCVYACGQSNMKSGWVYLFV
jgi:hypothetical protein